MAGSEPDLLSWLAAQMQKVQKSALFSDLNGRPFAAVFRQGQKRFLTLAVGTSGRKRMQKVQKSALFSDLNGRPFAAVFRQGHDRSLTLAVGTSGRKRSSSPRSASPKPVGRKKPMVKISGKANEPKPRN